MLTKIFLLCFCVLLVCASDGKNSTKHRLSLELSRQISALEHHMILGHDDKKLEEIYGNRYPDFGEINLDAGKGGNRTNDSVDIYRYLDNEFYGKVVINHETYSIAYDTSWDINWVFSSSCSNVFTLGCWFHKKYNHHSSKSYHPDNRPFHIQLTDNTNLTGFYSYEDFYFAHSNVSNQSFVEMDYAPYYFIFDKSDGVMGLGRKTSDYNPFFYTLLLQNKIKEPIFSIYLNRDKQSQRGGNVILGFIEYRHVHATVVNNKPVYDEILYLPINPKSSEWTFSIDRIHGNDDKNKSFPILACQKGCEGIVDSSTTIIYGPEDEVEKINDAIGAHLFLLNRYTIDCDTVNKLPKISFVLGGKEFILDGPAYTSKMSYHSITICVSAFVPTKSEGVWILGGAFLAEYYTIYNVNENKIGFVKAA